MKKVLSSLAIASLVTAGIGGQVASAATQNTVGTEVQKSNSKINALSTSVQLQNDEEIFGHYMMFQLGEKYKKLAPVIKNGTFMIPIKTFFTYIESPDYKWDNNLKKLTVTADDKKIEVKVGDKFSTLNGKKKKLDTPLQNINGHIYVPIRFLSEDLGAKVKWSQSEKKVTVIFREFQDIENYYINNKGELGPKISAHLAELRLEQGVKEGRELVHSYVTRNLIDGTGYMTTIHYGKHRTNENIYDIVTEITTDVDKHNTTFTDGRYYIEINNFATMKNKEDMAFTFKEGDTKEFKDRQEILTYTTNKLLDDIGSTQNDE